MSIKSQLARTKKAEAARLTMNKIVRLEKENATLKARVNSTMPDLAKRDERLLSEIAALEGKVEALEKTIREWPLGWNEEVGNVKPC